MNLADQFGGAVDQPSGFHLRRGVAALDVEPKKLLVAAYDAGLRDGGQTAGDDAYGVHPSAVEDGKQLVLLQIVAPEAAEDRLATEPGEVHRHVGGPSGTLVALGVANDRDRGFGRDAVDVAVDVAVEHDVAYYQYFELAETAFEEVQNGMQFGQHTWEGSLLPSSHLCERLKKWATGYGRVRDLSLFSPEWRAPRRGPLRP